jgi:uncharacterized protein (DUF427 family)
MSNASPKRESLWHRFPDYRVDLEPGPRRVCVRLAGQIVAESDRALRVLETKHAPVLYLPREDVRMDLLERTSHRTFCPFKGEASYWSPRVGERSEENAVWSYEEPFAEVAGLRELVAFYADRFDWEVDE